MFSNLDNYTSIFEDDGEKFKVEFEDPAFTPRKWEILNKEIILSYIRILFNSYKDFGFSLEQQIENLMSINTPALIFTKVKEGSGVLKAINGAFTVTINGEEKSYNNCDEYYKDLFSIEEEEILIPYNSLNYRH
jgi:hypothetical protein